MKITCIIIDDEPKALELLQMYIGQTPGLLLLESCYDAYEAMSAIKIATPDLIFLDINMPQVSGIELAALLPKEQPIIFTTAYAEHALKGYEFNAVDYLLKPFGPDRFLRAVNKAKEYIKLKKNNSVLFVRSGKELLHINLQEVLFFESMKEYIAIYTGNGKTLIYKRMKELEMELPAQFIRIHHSYIINTQKINKIGMGRVTIGDRELPISNGYKERFMQHIAGNVI